MSGNAGILKEEGAGRAVRLGEAYLEFVEKDDFISHLRRRQEVPEMRLEIAVMRGARAEHNMRSISFRAVATARFTDHIAIFSHTMLVTDNFKLEMERRAAEEKRRGVEDDSHEVDPQTEPTRARMFELFRQIWQAFEQEGIRVERGLWRYEAPAELLSEVNYE